MKNRNLILTLTASFLLSTLTSSVSQARVIEIGPGGEMKGPTSPAPVKPVKPVKPESGGRSRGYIPDYPNKGQMPQANFDAVTLAKLRHQAERLQSAGMSAKMFDTTAEAKLRHEMQRRMISASGAERQFSINKKMLVNVAGVGLVVLMFTGVGELIAVPAAAAGLIVMICSDINGKIQTQTLEMN